ncbi:MAG: hypothetical protein ACFFDF_12430 [Candidatus Odinarchaeota archaeon]
MIDILIIYQDKDETMKQTTLFDYLSEIEKVKQKNEISKKSSNLQKILSNPIKNQYKPLIKSLVQQNLTEIIVEKENFENLSTLIGDNWFYDDASFGFTDKNRIMCVSTLPKLNSSFFKLYNFEDFMKINEQQKQSLITLNEEYTKINNVEYDTIYLKKSIEILKESFQVCQHKTLKLLFLKDNKFGVIICPKF